MSGSRAARINFTLGPRRGHRVLQRQASVEGELYPPRRLVPLTTMSMLWLPHWRADQPIAPVRHGRLGAVSPRNLIWVGDCESRADHVGCGWQPSDCGRAR